MAPSFSYKSFSSHNFKSLINEEQGGGREKNTQTIPLINKIMKGNKNLLILYLNIQPRLGQIITSSTL